MNKQEIQVRKQRAWSFIIYSIMMYLVGLIAVAGEKITGRFLLWNIVISLSSATIFHFLNKYVDKRITKREQKKSSII